MKQNEILKWSGGSELVSYHKFCADSLKGAVL